MSEARKAHKPTTLTPTDDIKSLRLQLSDQALSYVDISARQRHHEALLHWPLLRELNEVWQARTTKAAASRSGDSDQQSA